MEPQILTFPGEKCLQMRMDEVRTHQKFILLHLFTQELEYYAVFEFIHFHLLSILYQALMFSFARINWWRQTKEGLIQFFTTPHVKSQILAFSSDWPIRHERFFNLSFDWLVLIRLYYCC
jgi:hypothetical protein